MPRSVMLLSVPAPIILFATAIDPLITVYRLVARIILGGTSRKGILCTLRSCPETSKGNLERNMPGGAR